jgi:hypothetical protein
MNEDVGTGSAGVGDETETLLVVEPFDYSLGHADGAGFDAILCAQWCVCGRGGKWSIAYWNAAADAAMMDGAKAAASDRPERPKTNTQVIILQLLKSGESRVVSA